MSSSIMDGFDPHNMTPEQRNFMLAQVYDGYKTKSRDKYEMMGAGDGRALRKTGTIEYFNPKAYEDSEVWTKIAKAADISSSKLSKLDVAQMYDFIQNADNKEELVLESFSEPKVDPVDDRSFEMSEELESAKNNVEDFRNNLDKTGNMLFGRSEKAAQSFKDNYATNLTRAYMEEDPTTLATEKAKMQEKDAQKANLLNNLDASRLSFSKSTA